jgi:para-aminobenzoate synthetase component I
MLQPWHWRALPLDQRCGSDVFTALFYGHSIATLLESPAASRADLPHLARYSICAGRPRRVAGVEQLWTPPIGTILPFLKSLPKLAPIGVPDLPFTGGWLGWLGYDLAWEIERLPSQNVDDLPFPVAYWYVPDCFAVLDHQQQQLWLAATERGDLEALQAHIESTPAAGEPPPSPQFWGSQAATADLTSPRIGGQGGEKGSTEVEPLPERLDPATRPEIRFQMSQDDYVAAILQAKAHIRSGDLFQANLSVRFETTTRANSWAIYQALSQINPSPFSSYWQTPWGDVISCSPERLVKLQGQQAETRPIAGTRRRGATPDQDAQLAAELQANAKERAEHIMLVDLARNDLGRVCDYGSVRVDELLVTERYSHVMHLVSNVVGQLKAEQDGIDLIRALFPGGTITGCPKVRCLEMIEALEPVRRSLFYGSCGYLDQRGNLDLNILIRTLLYQRQGDSTATVWGQVGAGIVADSVADREWLESLQKAQAQLAALQQVQGPSATKDRG